MRHIRTIIHIILFVCIFIHTSASLAPEIYKFNRIDVDKGLSNSEVKCIYQDATGFVWFGTPSGLNRYDGYEILVYKQDLKNPHISSNNDIEKIQEAYDGKLWLSTRMGYTIYDPREEAFEEKIEEILQEYIQTADIVDLYIDLGKNFWFITNSDIRIFDIKKKSLTIHPLGTSDSGLSAGRVIDIKQGKNRYWFLYDDGRLECMDAQTQKVISRDHTFSERSHLKNQENLRIFLDSSDHLWIYGPSTYTGLAYFNTSTSTWSFYSTTANSSSYRISNDVVISLAEDDKKNIWAGTDHGGVNIIDRQNGKVTILTHDERDPSSLPQNTIKYLYKDKADIMWLGTYKKGASYFHESIYKFKSVSGNSDMPYSDINCFYEVADGNIWIGTNGGGLLYYDRKKDTYIPYKHDPNNPNSPAGDVIVSLAQDQQGNLWIGYYLDGLDCFDGKKFTHYKEGDGLLEDNNAWKLSYDRSGNLWIGTLRGGVSVINTETRQRVKQLWLNGSIYDIFETKSGEMLIGSQTGLYIYNILTGQAELYEKDIFEEIQLYRNDINVLFEDSRKLLWIGTRNGVFVYNPYTKDIHIFGMENGLSADLVQSILEDDEHNMWIATNKGLTCIKISTAYDTPGYFFHLLNYDRSEGLQDEQFNFNAAYLTSKSELIFGGSSGFNIFTPQNLSYSNNIPNVVLTGFEIYNNFIQPNHPYDDRYILKQSITYTDKIELSYKDNYFSLSFTALDYFMPNKTRYFYKLEGFNDQWLEADQANRRVTYTNLNPGKYTFYLTAVNNEGIESKEPLKLHIYIHPPFWKTNWAILLYVLILIGMLILYRTYMARKAEQKLEYEKEKMRITQQHEMDEIKLRFFTNISHEFRTPLTLILTPLEELLKKVSDPEEKEALSIMQRNARQLLRLVNQLLDFRKLDVHRHTLQPSLGDIVQFISEQANLFSELMVRKHIQFEFKTNVQHLYMYFDADKLAKIMMNVLSNAYKFTPAEGKIILELSRTEENIIRISVTDTGVGIPTDALEKVFERFYQVNRGEGSNYQGSGIGLHLTKEFVLLHKGNIWAENVPEGGSKFIILLPCKEEVHHIELISSSMEEETDSTHMGAIAGEEMISDNVHPKLLIVDDNEDLRSFLISKLKDQYNILQAEDGVMGLEIAFKEIPDMILSDVMMPRMDGIEMSKTIKADIRTSHIPIILLTAKSGEESKLEGLKAGADDYITKPFNFEILTIKMYNLIETRKRKQDLFEKQIRIEPSKIAVSSLDEKLINKALEYTEANISNPDFSVEELSRELGMSRVHLYKKLSSLTGKTPIEFIRVIRLKRAAQLLEESQMTVSEIAYEVGFNNPKYFRKYFKDEFGVLPSQYGSRNE